ncbi:uncharacterized protein LOC127255849 [Andrographis paniculata]|uniref:uncharacterized protein LOC127255849 n=1 Tax=Andrographis paniculata TaxID=175694 RepID=UPI0021E7B525|nr:uncharacterized protein LOC127255849 [Andrographis paniculata]
MDHSKVSSVVEWLRSKSVRDIRGFLGLTGYYRRFVRGYGLIVIPLAALLKKAAPVVFEWPPEAEAAFVRLKKALTEAPVLAMPRFDQPFVVECDVSGTGVGAVLMQERCPVAYFSKTMADQTLTKFAYEREMMGLAIAVQHWRPYLIDRKFVVRTDHRSLKHLLTQNIVTPSQQLWVAKLLGYDFTIEYKTGASNAAADALSRRGEELELAAVSVPGWLGLDEVRSEQWQDASLRRIITAIEAGPDSSRGYEVIGGCLYYKGWLALSVRSRWIPQLLREFHDTPVGGHAANYQTLTPARWLHPLPIPMFVWEDISMDFITCLPKSRGYSNILVVVDRLSKYGHFIALKPPNTARSMAEAFMRDSSIAQDTSVDCESGTSLKFSSAYHAETDGQTEVLNRAVETYLRCFPCEQPKKWMRWLALAEYWYNTSFQTAAKMTPFEVVYRREPSSIKSRIYLVFHVSQLQRVVGDHPVEQELPVTLEIPVGPFFEPEEVLAARNVAEDGSEEDQVLVRWVGQTEDDATWVDLSEFRRQFPDFNLGNKVFLKRDGVDSEQDEGDQPVVKAATEPRPLLVYRRRSRD